MSKVADADGKPLVMYHCSAPHALSENSKEPDQERNWQLRNYDLAKDRIAYSRSNGLAGQSGRAARDARQEVILVDRNNQRPLATVNTFAPVKAFWDLPVDVHQVTVDCAFGVTLVWGSCYFIHVKLPDDDLVAMTIHEFYGHEMTASIVGGMRRHTLFEMEISWPYGNPPVKSATSATLRER